MGCKKCRRRPVLILLLLVSALYVLGLFFFPGFLPKNTDIMTIQYQGCLHGKKCDTPQRPDNTKTTKPPSDPQPDLREQCRRLGSPYRQKSTRLGRLPPAFNLGPYISDDPKYFFCSMAKAGSTFFTRYFLAVHKPGPMSNPFSIETRSASRVKLRKFESLKSTKEKFNFLDSSFKAIFTRNPFSRIFSAYIDKLYSPNPRYWKLWGNAALTLNELSSKDYPCGSGVSFRRFIKLAILCLSKTDIHFIPMDKLCRLCVVEYDFVGKLENSVADIDRFSRKLNVSPDFLYTESYKTSSIVDAINDSTRDAFSIWRHVISKCISDFDSGRIIWRKLQIRGLIDAANHFPFTENQMKTISLEKFRIECFKAMGNSKDEERLSRQKRIALYQAYSTLSERDILSLQQIYERDFKLGGYDKSRPGESKSTFWLESSDSLDWRVPWVFK